MKVRVFIGVMSGTSCDGVDAALVRVDGVGATMRATFLAMETVSYAVADQTTIQAARLNKLNVRDLTALGVTVAGYYVQAVRKLLESTGTEANEVTAVAAHGQTIYHSPPLTLQAFDPTVLARGAGIDVVSDFRRADCAAGGQGAPLVPFGDWVMFRNNRPRVLINIGGIANVTFVPVGASLHDVWGFDVGPGNCLSDWVMREHGGIDSQGVFVGRIDTGGRLAMKGQVMDDVAMVMLENEFFDRDAPKSTDTPLMIALFRHAMKLWPDATVESKLATANYIAASAINDAIDRHAAGVTNAGISGGFGGRDDDYDADWESEIGAEDSRDADDETTGGFLSQNGVEVYAAGGGVKNAHLIGLIEAKHGPVRPTDDLGVPAQAREAAAFALLAAAFVDRFPCHMPRVTGATSPAVLGSLTPAFSAPSPGMPGEGWGGGLPIRRAL